MNDRLVDELRLRWERTWPHAPSGVAEQFDRLVRAYTEPIRHYHDLRHIAMCFAELDTAGAVSADRRQVVEIALWFHDVVYDPRRSDNEAESALYAEDVCRSFGADRPVQAEVRRLILLTQHSQPPANGDLPGSLVCDIDLSILGQPAPVFDDYERGIRLEYGHVPDARFRAGRARVLRHLLNRERIYLTTPFADRYETAARANLSRSLVALNPSP